MSPRCLLALVSAAAQGVLVGITTIVVLALGSMAVAWIFDVAVVMPGVLHARVQRRPAESLALVLDAQGPGLPLVGVVAAAVTATLCVRGERRRRRAQNKGELGRTHSAERESERQRPLVLRFADEWRTEASGQQQQQQQQQQQPESLSEHQAERGRAPNDPQQHTCEKHQGSS